MTTLKKGSKGTEVKVQQYILSITSDGIFGQNTKSAVIDYQKRHGLSADGIVGDKTWTSIVKEAPTLRVGTIGVHVFAAQAILGTKETGTYAEADAEKAKVFQAAAGQTIDGIIGPNTWGALQEVTPKVNTGAFIQPVDYKQYDSRWGSVVYTSSGNKGQTIRNSGCGPTTMADIIATWFDKSVTPKTLCALAVKKGYRTKNSGTAWGFFKYIYGQYPFSKFVQTSSTDVAVSALKNGAYVIASMGPGYWTSAGHFICQWKADSTYIYANDPASSSRKKATIAKFKKESKQYFIFYK